jgi:hypothetical protein
MSKCPFALWREITGSSGLHLGGPAKIVHHTTEGSTAEGAMAAFRKNRSDPHFTVDRNGIYQHVDTDFGARALRNAEGGVQTNRDGAIQIELVGFAHKAKDPATLTNVARLCRWIEAEHGVPRTWPSGFPKPAQNGKDPGGHNRSAANWDEQSGHYGHCHVPENDHWDPGYTEAEVAFLMGAQFNAQGSLTTAPLPPAPAMAVMDGAVEDDHSSMPDHGSNALAAATRINGTARTLNVRPDTLDFRDKMYVPTLIEVPSTIPLERYTRLEMPVLDQGEEGACTGFGLAAVANYLLARRKTSPDKNQVSPRMFYELARRYDEWPGEDYSGSSARGAMKGWQKHGVCAEDDWPYKLGDHCKDGLTEKRMRAASTRPLGAYFRVNHKDLVAMHSAIAEAGVLYATATVHEGWSDVKADGAIPFMQRILGGHAFAIVAYDEEGFWIQNSWGLDWGKDGLARISYDDWLQNGTDVWVARLGAPVKLMDATSYATAHARTSGQSAAYSYIDLRPHLVSVGNNGKLRPGGDYGTTEEEIAAIFASDIPEYFSKSGKTPRLLLFAHGGLTDEETAVQRVAEYRAALLAEGIYPLAFVWHTDFWTTISNILEDSVRRRRPEGLLDSAKDFFFDRFDDFLEPVARYLSGKAAWSEMKENALLASRPGGAADIVTGHIAQLKKNIPQLELHIVGHSAGAVFHAPIVQRICSTGKIEGGPAHALQGLGLKLDSCTLWAPACTTALFREAYWPAIDARAVERFALYCLDDKTEQDDNCASIYNKSLLYLVSHAFEKKKRIPGFDDGEPLLGLHKWHRDELPDMFAKSNCSLVLAPNNEPRGSLGASKASRHGDFDDDDFTVESTLKRILGATSAVQLAAFKQDGSQFSRSANSIRRKRRMIDEQTR